MSTIRLPHPDTLALHAGSGPDPVTGARATPIYFTTSFSLESADAAAGLFNLERPGHVYSRISNPTVAAFEERIAALEGGVGAIAVASGQAALHLAVATLAAAGDHIVASRALYGGSHNLLGYTLKRFGIETTFVAPHDPQAWADAIRPNTKLLFGETVANPAGDVLDIPTIAAIAHSHDIALMVDATLTSPALQQPLTQGADLVMHSATKFLGGHGVAMGGVLVERGHFNWSQGGRYATLSAPYDGFHGMVFDDETPCTAFLLRARREGLRDFGASLSPMNAFQLLQGVETLGLRMERHVRNAQAVAEWLQAHPAVAQVHYAGLSSHRDYALAQTLLPQGVGSVFSFELKPTANTRLSGQRLIENLQVFSHLANVGDAKSLVIHPASTTHFRMDDAALAAAGIGPGTLRLSIGLEHAADLIDDLARAMHRL